MLDNKEEYPSNAHRYKNPNGTGLQKPERKEDLRPVAKGKVPKRTFRQWLTDNFLQASKEDVKKAVIEEWLIPGSKNLVEFVVHMMLFKGEKIDPRYRGGSRSDRRESGGRYLNAYDDSRRRDDSGLRTSRVSRQPEIEYPTKKEALDVRYHILEAMMDNKRATLKDLYQLSEMPTDYAMSNWGWVGLTENDIEIEMLPTGSWVLRMPKAIQLTK